MPSKPPFRPPKTVEQEKRLGRLHSRLRGTQQSGRFKFPPSGRYQGKTMSLHKSNVPSRST